MSNVEKNSVQSIIALLESLGVYSIIALEEQNSEFDHILLVKIAALDEMKRVANEVCKHYPKAQYKKTVEEGWFIGWIDLGKVQVHLMKSDDAKYIDN